jgi:hypothetical protein
LPIPLVAPVSVIHVELLAAAQPHPVVDVTDTLPVVAALDTDRLVGEIDGVAHAGENEKLFETVLFPAPPGPVADTRASKRRPGVGSTSSSGRKSTRITLLEFGVGLPRLNVAKAFGDPTGYIVSE